MVLTILKYGIFHSANFSLFIDPLLCPSIRAPLYGGAWMYGLEEGSENMNRYLFSEELELSLNEVLLFENIMPWLFHVRNNHGTKMKYRFVYILWHVVYAAP